MGVQMSVLYLDLCSFGYKPWSGIAGSYDSSMFSSLGNLQIALIVVVLAYIPTTVYKGFFCAHNHISIYCLCS
jgi:xanthine/uracil permease